MTQLEEVYFPVYNYKKCTSLCTIIGSVLPCQPSYLSVGWLAGWLVGLSDGWFLRHNFLEGREVTLEVISIFLSAHLFI